MDRMLSTYLNTQTKTASLAVFRLLFGIMMCISMVRFWSKGWIETLYIQPKFHFSYYGFEWIQPLGNYTYILFMICGLASIFIAIGYKYRVAIIVFFLSFTYIELMDKTTYLNHYYFISILSFLLIFLPAHRTFSVDAFLQKRSYEFVPRWTVDAIKLLLSIVYIHAGLAKLNSEWLFRAMPLKIWLPSKYDFPLIGSTLMQQEWFYFAMSWSGALYDLSIPFLLYFKKTRYIAFLLVVFFHVLTGYMFAIGMFPYIMIVAALIFFDANFHIKMINFIKKYIVRSTSEVKTHYKFEFSERKKKICAVILIPFFVLQFLLPWRYLLYPDELFWTEEGYKYSWRVLLTEKTGYASFKIVDAKTKKYFYVNNTDFLTPFQEKEMSCRPNYILEYAHYLGDHFKSQGHQNIQVYVESFVALNGRMSTTFINPKVDLYQQKESFKHNDWIVPFSSEIKIKGI
jgi:hypothetical protein